MVRQFPPMVTHPPTKRRTDPAKVLAATTVPLRDSPFLRQLANEQDKVNDCDWISKSTDMA